MKRVTLGLVISATLVLAELKIKEKENSSSKALEEKRKNSFFQGNSVRKKLYPVKTDNKEIENEKN